MSLRVARLVPANGILFVLLVIAAVLITSESPDGDSSAAEVTAYYADAGNRHGELAAFFLVALAGFCFLSFLGSLRGALARAEGEPSRLTTTATASGAAFVALALAGNAAAKAVPTGIEYFDELEVDPDVARVLLALSFDLFVLALFAAAAMTAAVSVLALYTRALPRWLAWFGFAATIAGLAGFFVWPSLVVFAWIAFTSAWLLRS